MPESALQESKRLRQECAKAGIGPAFIEEMWRLRRNDDLQNEFVRRADAMQNERYNTEKKQDWAWRIQAYLLQRFSVDIFTLCRILRSGASQANGWRTNYIVYVGAGHLKNLGYMLEVRGFERLACPALPAKIRSSKSSSSSSPSPSPSTPRPPPRDLPPQPPNEPLSPPTPEESPQMPPALGPARALRPRSRPPPRPPSPQYESLPP